MSNDKVNPSAHGWGVAIFIIILAIAANYTAYSIHQATYLKPDAPKEYRGIFRPIKTNVPGIEISELFPRQAKIADKFTWRGIQRTITAVLVYEGPQFASE